MNEVLPLQNMYKDELIKFETKKVFQGSRPTFQLASPVASDRFEIPLAKTHFSLARRRYLLL